MAGIAICEFGRRVGTWAAEVRSNRVFADPMMSAYFGMDAGEGASGPPVERYLSAVHADDRLRVGRAVRRAIVSSAPFSECYRVMTVHGTECRVAATGCCFRDAHGRPNLHMGHIVDVSDLSMHIQSLGDLAARLGFLSVSAERQGLSFVKYLIDMALHEVSEGSPFDGVESDVTEFVGIAHRTLSIGEENGKTG